MEHAILLDDNDLATAQMLAHAADYGGTLLRGMLLNDNDSLIASIGRVMKKVADAEPMVEVEDEPILLIDISILMIDLAMPQAQPQTQTFMIGNPEADESVIVETIVNAVIGVMETYSIPEIDAVMLVSGLCSFESFGLDPDKFDAEGHGMTFITDEHGVL